MLGRRRGRASNAWAGAAALAALVLYPLAISQPIMTLERFGHRTEASVWTGSIGLLEKGDWFVGGVVLLCSLVLPLLKLAGLVSITYGSDFLARKHRAFAYRFIEWTGRWGMLDVLLISVVVAWVKVGDLVDVTAGPAAFAFASMVVLSLLAAAWFDPHAIWEEQGTASNRS
jgi:paraquat-inducible protein A